MKNPYPKTIGAGALAICLLLSAAANAQRDGVVATPTPGDGPVAVDPGPTPDPLPSPYAGGYRLSINDTRGPQECLTYAVGWMRVGRDGSFVLWARNPEAGGSATVKGEVLRNGKLVFTPPLPNHIRAAVKIRRHGRCIDGLFGRYLVMTPVSDEPGDAVVDDADDDEPALAVVHDRRKKKAGVLIGFRR